MSPGCSLVREALSEGFLDFPFTRRGGPPLVLFPCYVLGRGRKGWGGGRTGTWVVPSRLAKYNTESMGITVVGMARGGGGVGEPECPRLDGVLQ